MMRYLLTCVVLGALLWPVQSWAAPSIASTSNTTYASRTNVTITAPSGIVDGDELYGCVFTFGTTTSPTVSAPDGSWTALSGSPTSVSNTQPHNGRMFCWRKTASGESGNYTFTHASGSSQGLMLRISGSDLGTPVVSTRAYTGGDTVSTSVFASITTTANDTLVIIIGHDWADTSNNLTAPTGSTPTFAEHIDTTLIYVASGVLASAGATGTKSMTNNNTGGDSRWANYTIGIAPSGGGPPAVVPRLMLMGVGP